MLTTSLNTLIDNPQSTPVLMTTGITYLLPKTRDLTANPSKYRTIMCLPNIFKLLTSIISTKMYNHLESNNRRRQTDQKITVNPLNVHTISYLEHVMRNWKTNLPIEHQRKNDTGRQHKHKMRHISTRRLEHFMVLFIPQAPNVHPQDTKERIYHRTRQYRNKTSLLYRWFKTIVKNERWFTLPLRLCGKI